MALPVLPKLNLIAAPSGNGWGFTPDRGWGFDGYTNYDGFVTGGGGIGGGGLPGGQGSGGGSGPGYTWDIGIGGVTVGAGGGGTVGTPGGVRNTTQQVTNAVTGLWTGIPWSRVAAFLLGLLLILGAIYLMRPVQQFVQQTARNAAIA